MSAQTQTLISELYSGTMMESILAVVVLAERRSKFTPPDRGQLNGFETDREVIQETDEMDESEVLATDAMIDAERWG